MKRVLLVLIIIFSTGIAKAQSDATMEETKQFILQKVNGAHWLDRDNYKEYWRKQVVNVKFLSDTIAFILKYVPSYNNDAHKDTVAAAFVIKIKDISIDVNKTLNHKEQFGTLEFVPVYGKEFAYFNQFTGGWSRGEGNIHFDIDKADEIERLIEALKHLIKLSGGKVEKF